MTHKRRNLLAGDRAAHRLRRWPKMTGLWVIGPTQAATPPTSVMNSRRFHWIVLPLARDGNLADTSGEDIMGHTSLTTLTQLRVEKNLQRLLPTRDAQFSWDQAHIGFSTGASSMQNNPGHRRS